MTVTEGSSQDSDGNGGAGWRTAHEDEGDYRRDRLGHGGYGHSGIRTSIRCRTFSTLTIAEGDTSETTTFTLTTKDDNIYEPDETVTVEGNATGGLDVTGTTLTIPDNDNPPTVRRLEVADDSDHGERCGEQHRR